MTLLQHYTFYTDIAVNVSLIFIMYFHCCCPRAKIQYIDYSDNKVVLQYSMYF